MTKVLIALAVVVVLAGGGYLYMNSSEGSGTEPESNSMSANNFASIMTSGATVQCDFTHEAAGSRTAGRVYVADRGEKIRGDFTISGAMNAEMHMIRTGGVNYIWGPAFPQGLKMTVTAENKNKLFESNNQASIPDDVQFNCSSWNVDNNQFSLPSGVAFVDIAAQMPGGANVQGSADMKAMQCAACDQAGSQRDQCRQALGCGN